MTGELEALRSKLAEPAKDTKLNLQSVFQTTTLSPAQVWGVAVASAIASRNQELSRAIVSEARSEVDQAVVEDAMAAASLMAMNNVLYRFKHVVGKESYLTKSARLRMNWIGKPKGSKVDFELFCLAVSAINGCEACMKGHEQGVLSAGLTEDQVYDAIRTAATIQAAAVSLELPSLTAEDSAATVTV